MKLPPLLVLLLCCGSVWAGELPRVKLITHWFAQPEDGGFIQAGVGGIWKKSGLDVEIVQGGPQTSVEKFVCTESNAMGILPAEQVLLGRNNGLPLVAVMVFFQKNPQAIMVHEESPVKSFADLNGRAVAVKPGAIYFQFLSKKYKLDQVKVVPPTGSVANFIHDPNYIQQAYPTNEPYYAGLAGVKARLLHVSSSGFDPYRCVVTTERTLKQHPEAVEAFVRGAYAGWTSYLKNPDPGNARILEMNPTQSKEGMVFAFKTMKELRFVEGEAARGDAPGQIKPERFQQLAKQLQELGLLRADLKVDEAYTTRFTPEALKVNFKF